MFIKAFLSLVLVFFLLSPMVEAVEEQPNIFLTLADSVNKKPVGDVFVALSVEGKDYYYFLNKDESLKLYINPGRYQLKFLISDPKTNGFDYYGTTSLTVSEKKVVDVVYLSPVGSVSGFIKDRNDNVVGGASLKFECSSMATVKYPDKADKFGSFLVDAVPVGSCKVYASFDGIIGIKEFNLKQGEAVSVDIQLNKPLSSKKTWYSGWWFFLAIFVVVLVIFLIGIIFKSKSTIKPKKAVNRENPEEKGLIGSRAQDILNTLRDNEKKIVEFLAEYKEPVHLSRIHYKTGISKGSLFRNLRSLEYKKVVESFAEGRVRKIKLSDWFKE